MTQPTTESRTSRRPYDAPQLVELGSFEDLTNFTKPHAGTDNGNNNST